MERPPRVVTALVVALAALLLAVTPSCIFFQSKAESPKADALTPPEKPAEDAAPRFAEWELWTALAAAVASLGGGAAWQVKRSRR